MGPGRVGTARRSRPRRRRGWAPGRRARGAAPASRAADAAAGRRRAPADAPPAASGPRSRRNRWARVRRARASRSAKRVAASATARRRPPRRCRPAVSASSARSRCTTLALEHAPGGERVRAAGSTASRASRRRWQSGATRSSSTRRTSITSAAVVEQPREEHLRLGHGRAELVVVGVDAAAAARSSAWLASDGVARARRRRPPARPPTTGRSTRAWKAPSGRPEGQQHDGVLDGWKPRTAGTSGDQVGRVCGRRRSTGWCLGWFHGTGVWVGAQQASSRGWALGDVDGCARRTRSPPACRRGATSGWGRQPVVDRVAGPCRCFVARSAGAFRADDPARGSRRVLRLGGTARQAIASRQARRRRRGRGPGRGGDRVLRGAHVRGALGDVHRGGPQAVSERRLPLGPLPCLPGHQPRGDGAAALGQPPGRTTVAGRGVRRPRGRRSP